MDAPVPPALLADAAERFRLLGDPVRLHLLNVLLERGEVAVQDLAEATGQSHQNTSKHLRKLADGGLVGTATHRRHPSQSLRHPLVNVRDPDRLRCRR